MIYFAMSWIQHKHGVMVMELYNHALKNFLSVDDDLEPGHNML